MLKPISQLFPAARHQQIGMFVNSEAADLAAARQHAMSVCCQSSKICWLTQPKIHQNQSTWHLVKEKRKNETRDENCLKSLIESNLFEASNFIANLFRRLICETINLIPLLPHSAKRVRVWESDGKNNLNDCCETNKKRARISQSWVSELNASLNGERERKQKD